MKRSSLRSSDIMYIVLLVLGFIGLAIPIQYDLGAAEGIITFLWISAFMTLTCGYRTVRRSILTGAVFCIAYFVRFAGATDIFLFDFALFVTIGLIMYGIFLLYAFLLNRRNSFITTLVFPAAWLLIYYAATLIKFPTPVRVDELFAKINVLIQSESLIGSLGLTFALLWIIALFHYSYFNRCRGITVLASALLLLLFVPGVIHLYPNVTSAETVRIAYTTGPYGGDFSNYEIPAIDVCTASMERSIKEASEAGAEILVFNEEAFPMQDTQEPVFLEELCSAARENEMHILAGLDIKDSDNSEGGKALNKLVWIDSNGEILGSYIKSHPIAIIESAYKKGDGVIPSHTINVGGKQLKVSYLICYDSNFPYFVSGIDDDTDILFLPSWDWNKVTRLHSNIVTTIAVENRVNILKPTYDGLSIAVNSDGRIIASSNTDADGFETLHVLDFPIGNDSVSAVWTPLNRYITAIVAADVLSLIVSLVLLMGNCIENKERTIRNRSFNMMLYLNILALGSDILSWGLDGSSRLETFILIESTLSIIMPFLMMAEFLRFLNAYIRERDKEYKSNLAIPNALLISATLATLYGCFSGLLISCTDGIYKEQSAYSVYIVFSLLLILIGFAKVVHNRKILGRHDRIAAYLYLAIPTVSATINTFYEHWTFIYAAITVSLLIIYVMLQHDRFDRLSLEKQISAYHASHDELTELNNRRTYDEQLARLSLADGPVGVIFSDLNNLKYTNDHNGHAAGDQLLIDFANTLRSCFRREEIFRISGDEFVVLLPGLSESAFDSRMRDLERKITIDDEKSACIGGAYGDCFDLSSLIKNAEARMYDQKTIYHRNHPRE